MGVLRFDRSIYQRAIDIWKYMIEQNEIGLERIGQINSRLSVVRNHYLITMTLKYLCTQDCTLQSVVNYE